MLTALATAKAIARALRAARRAGRVPEAIILSPELCDNLQAAALRYVWSVPKPHSMFGVPVEIHADAEEWATERRNPNRSLDFAHCALDADCAHDRALLVRDVQPPFGRIPEWAISVL
jgi:hypothetical protein